MRFHRKIPALNRARPGMTLMEVVIAIGIVAFVIPLILAATGSAGNSRRSAEADTRSAWLVKQVRQEILAKWAEPEQESVIEAAFPYPAGGAGSSTAVLVYDNGGEFISEGTPADISAPSTIANAAYLISVTAEPHSPPNGVLPATAEPMALISITIRHPAKAAPGNRSTFHYKLVSTRQGIL